MARRLKPLAPRVRPKLNKGDVLADGFLTTFSEHFRAHRDDTRRKRLLAGIAPDAQFGKMTVRGAIIFILTLSAARAWQASDSRAALYTRARNLSKFNNDPPAYMPSDVPQAQRLYRLRERNRIEALVALGFARDSGYATHSRALWNCIETAIRTNGLGDAPKFIRAKQDVDTLFEQIRARLNYLYTKLGKQVVQEEADQVFSLLHVQLRKTTLGGAELYGIYHAKHREV